VIWISELLTPRMVVTNVVPITVIFTLWCNCDYCMLGISNRYYSSFWYNFHYNLCVQFLGPGSTPWVSEMCFCSYCASVQPS